MDILFKNWEHIALVIGGISILLHSLEAGCAAAGLTKYEGIFTKAYAFIQGFLGQQAKGQ